MAAGEDQKPIQRLSPHRPNPALGESVGLRQAERRSDHIDSFCAEDVVEGGAGLGVPIVNQAPDCGEPLTKADREVAGLLDYPGVVWRGRAAGKVNPSRATSMMERRDRVVEAVTIRDELYEPTVADREGVDGRSLARIQFQVPFVTCNQALRPHSRFVGWRRANASNTRASRSFALFCLTQGVLKPGLEPVTRRESANPYVSRGSEMARSRASAASNCLAHCQSRMRCRISLRDEVVMRPGNEK